MKYPSDIVFTPSVKKFQKYYKSRSSYARMEETRGWNTKVTNDLAEFLTEIDSFYLGTANLNGQPYIQHRGGNKGFLKVIDEEHLGFVDFSGNKQYISIGNLSENSKATIFLMHYPSQTRIKIWGTAKVIEDANTIMSLKDDFNAKVERAIVFKIVAWDINCRQHIKQRYSIDQIEKIIEPLKKRINELEKELENRK